MRARVCLVATTLLACGDSTVASDASTGTDASADVAVDTGSIDAASEGSADGEAGAVVDFAGCPSDALKLAKFYPVTFNGDTGSWAYSGKWLSIKMTVPANANQSSSLEMYFSGVYAAGTGSWAISEMACDIDHPIIDPLGSNYAKNKLAYMKGYLTPNIDGFYTYGPTQATTTATGATMAIGKTYYLNVWFDTCSADNTGGCDFSNVKLP